LKTNSEARASFWIMPEPNPALPTPRFDYPLLRIAFFPHNRDQA